MDAEKWLKIKSIFNEAVDLETGKRSAFLDSVCDDDAEIRTQLEKLLAEDLKDETLFDPFIEPISLTTFTGKIDQTIGKYHLLKEIGEGGMGSVYLAQREDLGNKAALKIVKKGMDTADLLRRFQTEQQILANLEHPNIARLLDNGKTDDGLPYYVMEYVEGETLLKFAEKNQLSTRERLEIFRKICSAVQYAHNRLVVHRDLKPSNILITKDNEPKLLDFGIAKVLTPEKSEIKGTATILGMMTPNYASPEQLRGETVTTASDIYSLGVILYELLTGILPFNLKQFGLAEMMEVVSTTEPIRPSDVITGRHRDKGKITDGGNGSHLEIEINPKSEIQNPKSLRGDLDNIILKALKKEPDRRYLSAEQFSEDIRRHLEGLPVKARPDTFGYRTSKFIKRNKLSVAGASLIVLSLVGGIIGTTYQARVAQTERARAEKRFEDLRGLSSNLIFKYNESISNLPGATATRAMFVQEATSFLDSLADEQSKDARLQLELAQAYLKVGDLQSEISASNSEQTLDTYQKSLGVAEKLFESAPQDVEIQRLYATALIKVGSFQSANGWKDSALNNLQQALRIREDIQQKDPNNSENLFVLVEAYLAMANYYGLNKNELAGEFFQKALDLNEQLINDPTATNLEWRLFAKTNQSLANFLFAKPHQALNYHNKAIEFYQMVLDNKRNSLRAKEELGNALLLRANTYKILENNNSAAKDLQQAADIFEKLLQSDPKNEIYQELLSQTKKDNKSQPAKPEIKTENETIKDNLFKEND
jgi:serine/threonine protein kinase